MNYLNNHRGGFFRFFNGGANYGDVDDSGNEYGQQQYQNYQQSQQQQQQFDYQQQQQQQQLQQAPQGLPGLDLGTIQSLAEAINQGGGINLSNLGSNLGLLGNLATLGSAIGGGGTTAAAQKQPATSLASNLGLLSSLGSQLGLGETVSNLLTGLVGQRFAGRKARKLSKRSTEFSGDDLDHLLLSLDNEDSAEKGKLTTPSKKRNLNKEIGDDGTVENKSGIQKYKKYHQEEEKKDKIRQVEKLLGIQARIINKEEIQAEAEERIVNDNSFAQQFNSLQLNPIVFPDLIFPSPNQVSQANPSNTFFFPNYHGQGNPSGNALGENLAFPLTFSTDDYRGGKAIQFSHSTGPKVQPYNQLQFPETFQNSNGIILDIPKPLPLEYYDRTKMIFPDRRGTGNLRFDNEELFGPTTTQNLIRVGRILTGQNSQPISYQGTYNANSGSAAVSYNRGDYLIFHSSPQRGSSNDNRPQQQQQQHFDFGNRYPLNNNYLNSNRYQVPQQQQQPSRNEQRIYVTNSQGVTTHYLNERGEKFAV